MDDPVYEHVTKMLEDYIDEEGEEGCCVDQRALDMYSILMFLCRKVGHK